MYDMVGVGKSSRASPHGVFQRMIGGMEVQLETGAGVGVTSGFGLGLGVIKGLYATCWRPCPLEDPPTGYTYKEGSNLSWHPKA